MSDRPLADTMDHMDVLSGAIAAARTGRAHSSRTHRRAPWAARFLPFAGVGFHVVLQGSCWLLPSDGEPVPLGAGDVICVRPQAAEYAMADSPSTPLAGVAPTTLTGPGVEDGSGGVSTVLLCGAYLLGAARPHPLLAELPDVIHLSGRVGTHPSLRAAIDMLGLELAEPRQGTDAIMPALLDMLLLYILRAWLDEQADHGTATGWAAALADPPVAAALRGIHAEPARPWTVESLGDLAGLSRAAFARRFTALVGQPPLAYATWWRLNIAARLLRESDAPLAVVAARIGYTSEFAFAKAFKREYDMPPGEYRRTPST